MTQFQRRILGAVVVSGVVVLCIFGFAFFGGGSNPPASQKATPASQAAEAKAAEAKATTAPATPQAQAPATPATPQVAQGPVAPAPVLPAPRVDEITRKARQGLETANREAREAREAQAAKDAAAREDMAQKAIDLNADIEEAERRLEKAKNSIDVCKEVARTACYRAIFLQAEKDRKADEAVVAKLRAYLQQKRAELTALSSQ